MHLTYTHTHTHTHTHTYVRIYSRTEYFSESAQIICREVSKTPKRPEVTWARLSLTAVSFVTSVLSLHDSVSQWIPLCYSEPPASIITSLTGVWHWDLCALPRVRECSTASEQATPPPLCHTLPTPPPPLHATIQRIRATRSRAHTQKQSFCHFADIDTNIKSL